MLERIKKVLPLKKDRKLGVAEHTGRYDLPLHRSAGSGFLTLLVALMSFLAVMALSGSFALHDMTDRWVSGLENQATIEIPARKANGGLRENKDIEALAMRVSAVLKRMPHIREFSILEREEVSALISPWLGESVSMAEMPLPGLISVGFKASSSAQISDLSADLKGIAKDIRLDTHESWLDDILRVAGSLKIAAGFVTLVIALTTIIAIAGAVRSRMAEFHADIELLHLMGAGPDYISNQFQRHNVRLALKGSLMGIAAGGVSLFLFVLLSGNADHSLAPSLSVGALNIVALLCLPVIACLIAFWTARFTVHRTLSELP